MIETAPCDNLIFEREDRALTNAFRTATAGSIANPNVLQHALFPRLFSQDTGLLIPTGPGAGRLEAVFVPSLASLPVVESKQRLFVIGSDYGLLDDYRYRLARYVKALVAADRVSRLVYFADNGKSVCERFHCDGTVVLEPCDHPFDADVDLVVTRFSEFRSLFFEAGGVHGLPTALASREADDEIMRRRDLFYFDEAQGYTREEFSAFLRLVEFLFAEDLDVIVGSSTLPEAALEELSFLEVLYFPDANEEPMRSLSYVSQSEGGWGSARLMEMLASVNRAILIGSDAADVAALAVLARKIESAEVVVYESNIADEDRHTIYERLRVAEQDGKKRIIVADGPAIETSDLSSDLVATSLCTPESLLRRAGRCNRRSEVAEGKIVVVESGQPMSGRKMPEYSHRMYTETLRDCQRPVAFAGAAWIPFIG